VNIRTKLTVGPRDTFGQLVAVANPRELSIGGRMTALADSRNDIFSVQECGGNVKDDKDDGY
jgi:hypothetical protein